VRPLSMDEGPSFSGSLAERRTRSRLRRALGVLISGQGLTVRDIGSLLQVRADYVRDVIRGSTRGFAALDPKPSGR
jgi:hypothetical protein